LQKAIKISSIKSFNKSIVVPSDKSITHRAFILSSLANGISKVYFPLISADTVATINALKNFGFAIKCQGGYWSIVGNPNTQFGKDTQILVDAKNSGTTARLLIGFASGMIGTNVTIVGDKSLSRRPMQRVVKPLQKMGAIISQNNGNGDGLPIKIAGSRLIGINYCMPIASAQVKSAILIAALSATSCTTLQGLIDSRNHTEIMLKQMGASIKVESDSITINPSTLLPLTAKIPGDISSAAYFLVLAAIIPNSQITVKGVGINQTRTGILKVFDHCKIEYSFDNLVNDGEPYADITVRYCSDKRPFVIDCSLVPHLIDEIPILCVLACFINGKSIIKDVQELKFKESDRISAMVLTLKQMGADIVQTDSSMTIYGNGRLQGGASVDCSEDHRIAMSLTIAALASMQDTTILGAQSVNISFATFFETINQIIA